MASNPFGRAAALFPPETLGGPAPEELPLAAVMLSAEAMWDLLADAPAKAEAVLAQRRLEEAVYWAGRAMGGDALTFDLAAGAAPGGA